MLTYRTIPAKDIIIIGRSPYAPAVNVRALYGAEPRVSRHFQSAVHALHHLAPTAISPHAWPVDTSLDWS